MIFSIYFIVLLRINSSNYKKTKKVVIIKNNQVLLYTQDF